ncbi:very-short-patch-repair endonuclease [Corynebacterium mucifaciens]
MGMDREDAQALRHWEERKEELRAELVDKRRLAHDTFPDGEFVELEPTVWFPAATWGELSYHERQWLRVEAAAMVSNAAVLVGRSAARKLGMWVISRGEEPVEVALPSSQSRAQSGCYAFRFSKLRRDEQLIYEGHCITTPTRAFIDIARYHGFIEGLIAADYLLRRGIERDAIEKEIRKMGRAKGIGVARKCLEHAIPNSDSAYESLARGLLIEAGIGPVVAQARIERYYADLLVQGWLIIEIDGQIKYERDDAGEVWKKEFSRQKRIGNKGYVILRFESKLLREQPHVFIAEVRAALAGTEVLAARMG